MLKTKLLFIYINISILSGCSVYMERSAQYSEFKINGGYTRPDIINVLGKPNTTSSTEVDGGLRIIDTYSVKGRVFDCEDYETNATLAAITLGISEVITFPISLWEASSESSTPTEKQLEIYYLNDNYVCQFERDNTITNQ